MASVLSVLTGLADQVEALFKRLFLSLALSFAAGSFSSLAMAPLNAWPVLFISIPVLYLTITHTGSRKGAFFLGWLFGFGYFLFSLSWIGNALLVEGNPYKWAWILAVSGLPALLAFFPAFAALCSKKLLNLRSLWGWLGFVSFYCGFEWLRGHIFTGFPWNLFGYTWVDHLAVLQVLWLSDVYMLTWLTLLWTSIPACIILFKKQQKIICATIAGASFALCFVFGLWQLQGEQTYYKDINIRLVQPNIEQAEKWQADKMAGHFRKHLELSQNTEETDKPTIVVWPETALSYRIFNSPKAVGEIQTMLRSYNKSSDLLTGMLRFDESDKSYANSLVMIEGNGALGNVYNKHHLVPFGEYIPFQKWIPLAPIVQFKGFERGDGLQTLETVSGLKYSPLICYEIIFPGRSIQAGSSPDFIVNVTNDGWYGESAGPHQHLTQAIFRAVETGIPVIRSANTGFSGIVSPHGSIEGKTQLYSASAQNLALPDKKNQLVFVQTFKYRLFLLFILFFVFMGTRSERHLAQCS